MNRVWNLRISLLGQTKAIITQSITAIAAPAMIMRAILIQQVYIDNWPIVHAPALIPASQTNRRPIAAVRLAALY